VQRFGRDAPDGVRLVVASRIDRPNPGCQCCGVSAEQLLRELEHGDQVVVADLEAGLGTVARLEEGQADVMLVVAQPTAKSLEVAQRVLELASARALPVVVIANRVRDEADLASTLAALGDGHEIAVVPDDPAIAQADRDGRAAIDVDPEAPGVLVLIDLAERLAATPVAT
jgi:CO dehydrogenase maturation factor